MTRCETRRAVLIQCALITSAALLVLAIVPEAHAGELEDRGRAACETMARLDPARSAMDADELDACADALAESLDAAGCKDVVSVLACIAEVETLADSQECEVLCSGTTGTGGVADNDSPEPEPTPTPEDANRVGEESRLIDEACQHAAAIRTEGMDIDAPADSNPTVEGCVDELERNCEAATAAATCMLDASSAAGLDDCMSACQ